MKKSADLYYNRDTLPSSDVNLGVQHPTLAAALKPTGQRTIKTKPTNYFTIIYKIEAASISEIELQGMQPKLFSFSGEP
jgi:hypothetical protein